MRRLILAAFVLLMFIPAMALGQFEAWQPQYMLGSYLPMGQEDNQVKFQMSQKMDLYDMSELIDGLQVVGGYTQTTWGDVEAVSAPFHSDFKPSTWLEKSFGTWSVRYGWEHGSNGADGEQSRSWDRQLVGIDGEFSMFGGDLRGEFHPVFWQAFAVGENEEILDYRAVGGRVGFEGWARVFWKDKVFLSAEGGQNRIFTQVGINTAPGLKSWFLTGSYFNGHGDSLRDFSQFVEALGVGITFVPGAGV